MLDVYGIYLFFLLLASDCFDAKSHDKHQCNKFKKNITVLLLIGKLNVGTS